MNFLQHRSSFQQHLYSCITTQPYRLYSSYSGYTLVAVSCKQGNEPSGSIKVKEFPDYLRTVYYITRSFMVWTPHEISFGWSNQECDGRDTWDLSGTGYVHTGFGWGDPRKGGHLENLRADWRITLKWISKKWDREEWTGMIWLRTRTGGGLLWMRWRTSVSKKYGEFLDSLRTC